MKIEFCIPGPPVPKGRGRSYRTAKGIGVHTPEATRSFEAMVKHHAAEAMRGHSIIEGPVRLSIVIRYLAKKGTPKWAQGLTLPKATKPDWDNLGKAISDGMNGIVYRDDGQIYDSHVSKWHAPMGETAYALVTVEAGEPLHSPKKKKATDERA